MIQVKATKETEQTLIDIGHHMFKHRKALRLALNETGSEVVNKIANYIFNPPKTGRMYVYNGRPYQASAPGESPANRSGRLAKSSDYKVRGYTEMTVGETAPYAGFLEYGTRKMKPRPHIIRAINANHRNMIRSITEYIEQELSR